MPAEMLPTTLPYGDITFQLAPAWTDHPNAVATKGQTIAAPGKFNRIYILPPLMGIKPAPSSWAITAWT